MRPKDCISFWISMLNRDPDTLLCRELLSGIISDRVEYMSLFIHELLKVEQSKMESVRMPFKYDSLFFFPFC